VSAWAHEMHQPVNQSGAARPSSAATRRNASIVATLLLLAACGGDGGNGGGGGNTPPTANAGADQTVSELTVVNLSGSGSDANGDALTFAWVQTAGTTVTLNNAGSAQADFMAPDVAAGNPEVLTFRLTVSDGSANTTDTIDITVEEPSPTVTVFGKVNYEFVPPNPAIGNNLCPGLNFDADERQVRPIRGATVQLIDVATGGVLAATVSDNVGDYSFPNIDANTLVRLRVRAELKKTTGASRWDVEVRDNVDTSGSPPPLGSRPLYVVESADFDTSSFSTREFNMTAETGWTGSSYGSPRAAAPFAILDAVYAATKFVESTDPGAFFPPLDAFWSDENTAKDVVNSDCRLLLPELIRACEIDAGELGASFYSSGIDSLFLVGDASDDTDEFDDHVIVHEWGHYFEDNFSRSDSIGGTHSLGDRLDARLAFGEGWATALAAMALDNPLYCDTGAAGSSGGFGINAESGTFGGQGWYDEISVVRLIYDLWDINSEGTDTGSIGFDPIYNIMVGEQVTTAAFTTIFSFAAELRAILDQTGKDLLDAQLGDEQIDASVLNIWGDNETNDAGGAPDVMPIYTDFAADGSILRICSNSQFDNRRHGNKLSEYRYLRVNVANTARYRIEVNTVNPPSTPPPGYNCNTAPDTDPNIHMHSDPDITIMRNGVSAVPFPEGLSCEPNQEVANTNVLSPGTYVMDITEFRFADSESPADFPRPSETQICFDVTMQAI